jgi:hypothetical protein
MMTKKGQKPFWKASANMARPAITWLRARKRSVEK